ncbi:hypothetical protein BP6252_12141 [Coleophoma cylindrospora]|uniref:Phospholipase/carboxylesterase/thioesterase domain-containing protein n=1 Tax=Coleophoma cylindrospora TaxID=1849047 RepID=A0A3D8QGE0_9HELO|nr:hypothetical protein BP6252_12141 [Coleophoma cylindrospora]
MNTFIVAPSHQHTHTVIFLHGRDSYAKEFAEEFFESQASDDRFFQDIFPAFKWVFPSARPLMSSVFGTEMSQWFDMSSVEKPEERKELQLEGLKENIAAIKDIILSEASQFPTFSPDRIILAGISQGCATAILALLSSQIRICGFMGLSSWLPFSSEVEQLAAGAKQHSFSITDIENLYHLRHTTSSEAKIDIEKVKSTLQTPVLLSHCQDDEVVPIANGKKLCQSLNKIGMTVTWKEYGDGGHWINEPQGVDDMVEFMQNIIL